MKNVLKSLVLTMAATAVVSSAIAQNTPASNGRPEVSVELPKRLGLGQRAPQEPAKISRLGLSDPLVQQKYLGEPDLMRFLRGTYSEACVRGYMANTLKQLKTDESLPVPADARKASSTLLDSKRIWKMTSFEMETIFGKSYLMAANHCDCLVQDVSDSDLVNPKKGLEVLKEMPEKTRQACERIATERTEKQFKVNQQLYPKGKP